MTFEEKLLLPVDILSAISTLYLRTSDSPDSVLLFTNRFLFVEPWEKPDRLKFPEKIAFLVVRVPMGHTNVALRFGILNDSAPRYATVDDPALTTDLVQLELFMESDPETVALRDSPLSRPIFG